MSDLVVKNVDLFGDTVMAAQDKAGNIWVGVRWICEGLGMTEGHLKRQIANIKKDLTLSRGGSNLILNKGSGEREVFCLKLDYVPLWLAKVNITPTIQAERPELADKLIEYQLKAKDILADAFLPNRESAPAQICNPSEIQLGELASYLKIMDRVANRQNLASYKIAENFKKVSEQFGVQLSDDFVNVPEYVQQSLDI